MSASVKHRLEEKCRETEEEIIGLRHALTDSSKEIEGRCKAFQDTIAMLASDPAHAPFKKKLEDKIKRERQSLETDEADLAEALARLSGYKEALKMLERGGDDASEPELRAGSELFRIREAMRTMGQPLTLTQMLEILGEKDNPLKRNSVRGSVGRYARDGKIFVQTAPNTFGLLELGHKPDTSVSHAEAEYA